MTTPQKRKGDKAELEVQTICRDLFGCGRRALGAGRLDDRGDIDEIPGVVIQVANYASLDRAVSTKLGTVAGQMENARALAGSLWCRRRGGKYVVVLTPEQWADLLHRAGIA